MVMPTQWKEVQGTLIFLKNNSMISTISMQLKINIQSQKKFTLSFQSKMMIKIKTVLLFFKWAFHTKKQTQ